jgi:hypothetical protein
MRLHGDLARLLYEDAREAIADLEPLDLSPAPRMHAAPRPPPPPAAPAPPRPTRDRRDENARRRTPGGRVRITGADRAQLRTLRVWLAGECRRDVGEEQRREWLRTLARLETRQEQRRRK